MVGSFLMLGFVRGRFLILIVISSIVPFVFTWTTPGLSPMDHFRFTQATYPFMLIAAFLSVGQGIRIGRSLLLNRVGLLETVRKPEVVRVATAIAGLFALWVVLNVLLVMRLREDLSVGRGVVVMAGPRDLAFFRTGWYPPITSPSGNVTARFQRGRAGHVFVPMLPNRAHRLTLRIDPFVFPAAPVQRVSVSVNGVSLATLELTWNPERIDEYFVNVPSSVASEGFGQIDLEADYSTVVGAVRPPVCSSDDSSGTFHEVVSRNYGAVRGEG